MDLFFRREAAGGAGPAVGTAWASVGAAFAATVEAGTAEVVDVAFAVPRLPNKLVAEEVAAVVGAVVTAAGVPPEVVSADDFCPMLPNKAEVGAVVAGVVDAGVCPKLPNKLDVGAEVVGILPKREDEGAPVVAAKLEVSSDGALVAVVVELPPNSPGPLAAVVAVLAPKGEAVLVVVVEDRPPNNVGAVVAVVNGLETAG